MADKIKNAIAEEAAHVRVIAKDLVMSGTYFYPLKGIIYTANHRPLWRPFLSRSYQTLSLGVGVTSAMFFFTYVPQAAVMAITSGPLAPVSAALLVLSESSTITTFLIRSFYLADALTDTFDGTLIEEGQDALVSQDRPVVPHGKAADAIARLGNTFKGPLERFRPRNLLRSLLLLPLNCVPVVGTAVYVYIQGKQFGPDAHERFFQLKGWKGKEVDEWVTKFRGAYTGFGMASFALEMIPFASIAFAFTNTVGAALWAADMERAIQ
ncbi:hypothetical protein BO70DRAFT_358475 [Aspergillus heteromorphus CBS 117.55]|uniref:Outer spore wall protein RRT8 n=1 Tax=Aspergillus heteromorphus CBS 117.55 TaxID=1448321 RepID=A0A317X0E8_9EURO|nr:uncharacterized protein BO70DRAFT_358475 [Aspergillus heteromorphus CBS 117.55]PWY91037.1 hypothetical protein BO70DRAFT_358475 [Aspergillus heteromorphus CBS 117.55]